MLDGVSLLLIRLDPPTRRALRTPVKGMWFEV